jgi:hypothetical protein
MLLILVGVGGTAYASEDALPGDPLYAFKVSVSEPVQAALIPSEEGKASWHAILAERRLNEAARLAAENRLTPDDQEKLAANFAEHLEVSSEAAEHLAKTGHTDSSLAVRSDLEARLMAHEHILSVIAAHYEQSSSTAPTGPAVAKILAIVQEQEDTATTARLALEHAISPKRVPDAIEAEDARAVVPVATLFSAAAHDDEDDSETPPSPSDELIERASLLREREAQHIIQQNAALLSKFLPVSTSSASSTDEATSTEAASTEATSTEPAPATSVLMQLIGK